MVISASPLGTSSQAEIARLKEELEMRDQLVQQLSQELFRLVKGNQDFLPTPEVSEQHQQEVRSLREQMQQLEEQVQMLKSQSRLQELQYIAEKQLLEDELNSVREATKHRYSTCTAN